MTKRLNDMPEQHGKSKNICSFSRIVERVKKLNLLSREDVVDAITLSKLLIREWMQNKDKRHKIKLRRTNNIKQLYHNDALGDIIVDLLCLINDKALCYAIQR